jgi:hypothetical protein
MTRAKEEVSAGLRSTDGQALSSVECEELASVTPMRHPAARPLWTLNPRLFLL